ncbi:translocation/assembly module TamB [Agrobacterium vitis]|nr:translocation/assembly module TamB [Agrobacterium vitis]
MRRRSARSAWMWPYRSIPIPTATNTAYMSVLDKVSDAEAAVRDRRRSEQTVSALKTLFSGLGRILAYGLLVLAAMLVVALTLIGTTQFGSRFIGDFVASLVSKPNRIIAVDGISGLLDGHLRVDTITVSDANGAYGRIQDLSIDWSPLALMSRRFEASQIKAASLTLARKPLPAEETATEASSSNGFSLPVDIRIERVSVPEIRLEQPLLGTAAKLALDGNVEAQRGSEATPQAITSQLTVSRADLPQANLSAQLAYAPQQNRLDVDATLQEPKGGILANLLQLPDDPALAITVKGGGPINDWKGSLTATLDGTPRLDITTTHRLAADGRHVAVNGAGAFDSLLPANLRDLFAGKTMIDIAARLSDDGALSVEKGSVETGSLSLAASGTYTPKGENSLHATLTGKNGPAAIRWPLDDGTLAAQVSGLTFSLTGAAEAAKLETTAALASLTLPQGTLGDIALKASAPAFNLTTRSGSIDTTLTVQQAQLTDPTLARAIKAPLTLKAPIAVSPQQITAQPLTIESPALGGSVTAAYTIASKAVEAQYTLFARPEALPQAVTEKLLGTPGGTEQTNMVKLSGEARYSAGDGIVIPGFTLETRLLNASGKLSFVRQQLTTTLSGMVTDLSILQANASGKAAFELQANGPINALQTNGTITIDAAKLAGRALTGFSMVAKADLTRGAPSATLTAQGALDGKPVRSNLNLTSKDGVIALPDLSLTVGDNRLSGALNFSRALLPSGSVDFDFPDLGLLAALGGQTASGDLKGSIRLDEANGKIAARIKAEGTAIRQGSTTIAQPSVDVTTNDLQSLALQGMVKADRISTGSALVEQLALQFDRRGTRTDIDLSGRYDNAPLTGKALVQQDGNSIGIALQDFAVSPRGIAITLARPTDITVENGTATIETLTIKAGSGTITVAGKAGAALDMTAQINALPASLANTFSANLGATGTLSGKITATGSTSAPKIAYDLRLDDASVTQMQSAGVPPLAITASGTFADNRLSVDSRVTGGGGLNVTGGGSLTLAGDKPINMAFKANLPLSALQGLLTKQGLTAEGTANGDIRIGGTLSSPALSGTISTAKARLIDVKHNIALEQLAVDIALTGDQARINSVTGRISAGGRVSATGTIDLKGQGLPSDLTIKLDNAIYIDGTLVTATVNGSMGLKGPLLDGPTLSGKLTLDKTSITIPSRLPGSIAQLDIKHKNAPADVRRQTAILNPEKTRDGSSSPILLDLQIAAPSQIFVRGRGIDAELNGTVTIKGSIAAPQVSGGFTMRRGRMVILTKRLDFSSGKITFSGGLIPVVDFEATSTSGSTTLTAKVSGVATDPDISFSSAPALPQDEVLAQLIFGQSMAKLSPLQIAQLADAVGQLGGGNSTSLFNSLRSAVGVDDLDISTDSKGNTQFSAGKYLNDKTYLEFQQGSSGSKAVINLDVGRGFKLKGEAGASGSSGGGVFYEKEY